MWVDEQHEEREEKKKKGKKNGKKMTDLKKNGKKNDGSRGVTMKKKKIENNKDCKTFELVTKEKTKDQKIER